MVTSAEALSWWRRKLSLLAGGIAVVVLLSVTIWFFFFRVHGEAIDSVAVLPFVNEKINPTEK